MNSNQESRQIQSEGELSPEQSTHSLRTVFVRKDDEQLGPFTPDEVVAAMAMGRFSEDDYAWHPGIQDWQKLGTLLPGVRTPRVMFKEKVGETLGAIVLILVPILCAIAPRNDPSWIEQMIKTPVVSLVFITFGCISLWRVWKQ
ncbi:DUF4339 domain-containing protein [Verrucomicrobiota bacterium sgz303538]